MPSITEIEELIVGLHREGKTMREIAKVVHKNFAYIGAILRRRFPEEFTKTNTNSKETKALKLFYENKSPTQVAIELHLSAAETENFYTSFWRLEGLYNLYRIYVGLKWWNIRAFTRFYNQLRDRKMATRRGFNKIIQMIDADNATDKQSTYLHIDTTQIQNNDSPTDVLTW